MEHEGGRNICLVLAVKDALVAALHKQTRPDSEKNDTRKRTYKATRIKELQ